jgi:hypothetical protein
VAGVQKLFKVASRVSGVVARFEVESIDRGMQRIGNTLKSIQTDKSYVKAGLLSGKAGKPRKGEKANLTSVQIGIWNEFGSDRVPARPFIRPSFEANRARYLELLTVLVRQAVYAGKMPFAKALAIIGQKMAADMKKYVTAGPPIPPPNEEHYFQEKVERGYHKIAKRRRAAAKAGKPVPEGPMLPPRTLVDTGMMVNSITYGVVLKSTGDVKAGKDYGTP